MSIRSTASCCQPRVERVVPRGARTGRGPEEAAPVVSVLSAVSGVSDVRRLGAHGPGVYAARGAATARPRQGRRPASSCSPNRRSPTENAETTTPRSRARRGTCAGPRRRCRCRRAARRAPPPRCRRRRRTGRRHPRRRSRASRGRSASEYAPGRRCATTADARSSPSTTTPNAAASTLAANVRVRGGVGERLLLEVDGHAAEVRREDGEERPVLDDGARGARRGEGAGRGESRQRPARRRRRGPG